MDQEQHDHWARVYAERDPTSVSWYQPEAEPSLRALDRFGASPSSGLIDVGGGASTLVDALLQRGWRDVTVLDIAASALEAARARLGSKAEAVNWEVADITNWQPPRQYGVWHDRAVFHFLTDPHERDAYRRALLQGLAPGGLLIMATFAPEGPERCSGLPVQRYDAASLAAELGAEFQLLDGWRAMHSTPSGAEQAFSWAAFKRID